jgi:hypothetical protein
MSLGTCEDEIIGKFKKLILHADQNGMLCEGANQIETKLNGHNCTIRFFINNGEVMRVNGFKIDQPMQRKLGNIIQLDGYEI